ncbi:Hypothetical protein NCS54_01477100 [Fusarium falciforme]|uniref:Hypothetical protein n=1 Tax=Fusarium falciforme TaxID=195108 RepID=UPI0022FFDF0C|nr:Hypothetical protein NCS54_01477100 [Fusarium falciforme]WAO97065.1 Hypothetical protein NCS54_01477100 [Fusarium falciforme]
MKLSNFSGVAWLMLAHGNLAVASVSFDTCSPLEATTCTCPPIKKCAPRQYDYPEDHFPRDGDTCTDTSPACCVKRGDGPLKVTDATSTDNLQCGSNWDDSGVVNGITYTVEDCPNSDEQCLHVVVTPKTGITEGVHLYLDDEPITEVSGPGQWNMNDWCTKAGCWVPVSEIIDQFDSPKPASLCGKKIYIAPHVSTAGTGSCTAQGENIHEQGNWFMYSHLTFECEADICQKKCCCPSLVK